MNNNHLVPRLLLITTALVSCVDSDDQPAEPPLATLAATQSSTAQLGIATWVVTKNADETHVIGRDTSAARVVEMVIHRDQVNPDQRARVDVVYPERATFELTADGAVSGEASVYAKALYADLGHRTTPAVAATSIVPDYALYMQGQINMGWSLFGYEGYLDVGNWCPGSTRSEETYAFSFFGKAWKCSIEWKSFIVTDCRARVHYAISGDHWDTCYWEIDVN